MAKHENLLLVRMLRYQGQLADSDLQVVLSHAERARDHQELLKQLGQLGIVDDDWIERAGRYLRAKSRSCRGLGEDLGRFDRSFGQVALSKGWIELSQLEAALLEQERLRRTNLSFRLGEILVRLGSLGVDQVRDILRQQGYEVMKCRSCDLVLAFGAEELCPTCEGALEPTEFLDIVRSDVSSRA